MSKHLRILIAILITLTSLTSAGTVSVAQETGSSESFTSELTGSVVEIVDTSEGAFMHEYYWMGQTTDGYVQEDIFIEHGSSDVVVSFTRGYIYPQKWNDDTFAQLPFDRKNYAFILGEGSDAEQSWFLTRQSNFLDIDRHLYSEFQMDIGNGHTAAVYVTANARDLIPTIKWAQEYLKVDGIAVFAHADLSEIQAMLDGTSSFVPIRLEGFTSDVDHWADMGLVSANEWQHPHYGHMVTWNDSTAWEFPFYLDFASRYYPETDSYEFILQRDDFSAYSWISFYEENLTVAELAEHDSSPEWLDESGRNSPALAVTTTTTAYAVVTTWTPVYGVIVNITQGVIMPDGTIFDISLHATPGNIVEAYLDLVAVLEINGEPIDQLWTKAELEEAISPLVDSTSPPASDSELDESSTVTRTNRGSSESQSPEAGDSMVAPVSGVTIDLGSSGELTHLEEDHYIADGRSYTLESFTFKYGATLVVIDVMDGQVDVDEYMLLVESNLSGSSDYMDWLGGEWSSTHSWDVYSRAYKLDYREIVYIDLVQDPQTGLYFGIGVYGSETSWMSDITWLQQNMAINGEAILGLADTDLIATATDGSGDFVAEPVPGNITTVADWEADGLVSETEWQSPVDGTIFTWDGENLIFPFGQSDAIWLGDGATFVELRTPDRRGEVRLRTSESDGTLTEWVEYFSSDEYIQLPTRSKDAEVLDSRVTDESGSVIVLMHTELGDPVVVILDVYINQDGVTIITQISAAPADIADVYAIVWDSVQSNGDYYPLTWDVEEIGAFETDSQ